MSFPDAELSAANPSHFFGEAAKFCHSSALIDHAMTIGRTAVRVLANMNLSATTGILTIRGEVRDLIGVCRVIL